MTVAQVNKAYFKIQLSANNRMITIAKEIKFRNDAGTILYRDFVEL